MSIAIPTSCGYITTDTIPFFTICSWQSKQQSATCQSNILQYQHSNLFTSSPESIKMYKHLVNHPVHMHAPSFTCHLSIILNPTYQLIAFYLFLSEQPAVYRYGDAELSQAHDCLRARMAAPELKKLVHSSHTSLCNSSWLACSRVRTRHVWS